MTNEKARGPSELLQDAPKAMIFVDASSDSKDSECLVD
jgi:hypothetical protein